jgi:hypothetical protein
MRRPGKEILDLCSRPPVLSSAVRRLVKAGITGYASSVCPRSNRLQPRRLRRNRESLIMRGAPQAPLSFAQGRMCAVGLAWHKLPDNALGFGSSLRVTWVCDTMFSTSALVRPWVLRLYYRGPATRRLPNVAFLLAPPLTLRRSRP